MKNLSALSLILISLSSCQFLASPAALPIEEKIVEEVIEIVEHELEQPPEK